MHELAPTRPALYRVERIYNELTHHRGASSRRPHGKAGCSWYVDETYIKVHGHWRYLYRATVG
jgi:transposase-like protein